MPLQLTITDPLSLTEAERFAVLTFCQIRVTERDASKIASPRNEPRDSVREVIADASNRPRAEVIQLHESTGDPTSRGEVRIDPLDDPSHGIVPVPPVPGAPMQAGPDYAAVFGAALAPSVPIPPVPGVTAPIAPVAPSAPLAPVPAASAPSVGASDAALPPAAPPNPSNALDVQGMPWDHRIHATTKGKNQDGTWRMKRGVDEKLVADVVEQNRRLMAIAPPPIPPAAAAPVPIATQMPLAPVEQQPVPVAPPVPGAAEQTMTFPELMEQIIRLINGAKISVEGANAACLPLGITFLHQLDKRPDLIPAAWGYVQRAAGVAA